MPQKELGQFFSHGRKIEVFLYFAVINPRPKFSYLFRIMSFFQTSLQSLTGLIFFGFENQVLI